MTQRPPQELYKNTLVSLSNCTLKSVNFNRAADLVGRLFSVYDANKSELPTSAPLTDAIKALEKNNKLVDVCNFLVQKNLANPQSIMKSVRELHKDANTISEVSATLNLDKATFKHVNRGVVEYLGELKDTTLNQISQWLYGKKYNSIEENQKRVIEEGVQFAFNYMLKNNFAQQNQEQFGPNSTLLLAELSCVFAILGNRNGKDLSNIAFSGIQKTDDVENNALNALNVLFDEDGVFNEKFFEPQIYIDGKKSSISNRGKSRWAKLLTTVYGSYSPTRQEETQKQTNEEEGSTSQKETQQTTYTEASQEEFVSSLISNFFGLDPDDQLTQEIISHINNDKIPSLAALSNKNIEEIQFEELTDEQLEIILKAVVDTLLAQNARDNAKEKSFPLNLSKFIDFALTQDKASFSENWLEYLCFICDWQLNGGRHSSRLDPPAYATKENVKNALSELGYTTEKQTSSLKKVLNIVPQALHITSTTIGTFKDHLNNSRYDAYLEVVAKDTTETNYVTVGRVLLTIYKQNYKQEPGTKEQQKTTSQ